MRRATRRTGRFEYQTLLPTHVKAEEVGATLHESVLTVTVHKAQANKPRHTSITESCLLPVRVPKPPLGGPVPRVAPPCDGRSVGTAKRDHMLMPHVRTAAAALRAYRSAWAGTLRDPLS
ncbi:Hsp20/alpha crystallin family protein [Streptomyces mirabilis]